MVKIKYGNNGYFLSVNGHSIKANKNSPYGITATFLDGNPSPWIATEFASISALREFWNAYRQAILFITKN
jgi:propanediol dehydratase large subunit